MDIRERFIRFLLKNLGESEFVRSVARIQDNVKVILEDVITGEKMIYETHNTACNFELSALNQWLTGRNNTGQNALVPPSQLMLGNGSGTPQPSDPGLFNPLPSTLTTLSYAQADNPQLGTCTFAFQIAAGVITQQITEALLRDVSGNPWNHAMFPVPFTPTSTQNVTILWEITLKN